MCRSVLNTQRKRQFVEEALRVKTSTGETGQPHFHVGLYRHFHLGEHIHTRQTSNKDVYEYWKIDLVSQYGVNPLPTIGNSLKKQKSLYKVLTPSSKPPM